MRKTTLSMFFSGFVLVAIMLSFHFPSSINAQSGDGSNLQALIQELRELRRTLQETMQTSARTQLMLEKWRIQQSLVERLSHEQHSIEDQIAGEKAALNQLNQTAQRLEEQNKFESNPDQKKSLEQDIQSVKANAEEIKQRMERLEKREAETARTLNAEKLKEQEERDKIEALVR